MEGGPEIWFRRLFGSFLGAQKGTRRRNPWTAKIDLHFTRESGYSATTFGPKDAGERVRIPRDLGRSWLWFGGVVLGYRVIVYCCFSKRVIKDN